MKKINKWALFDVGIVNIPDEVATYTSSSPEKITISDEILHKNKEFSPTIFFKEPMKSSKTLKSESSDHLLIIMNSLLKKK